MYIYLHMSIYFKCICIYRYVYIFICIYFYVYMYVFIYAYIYKFMYVKNIFVFLCTYVYMYICVYVVYRIHSRSLSGTSWDWHNSCSWSFESNKRGIFRRAKKMGQLTNLGREKLESFAQSIFSACWGIVRVLAYHWSHHMSCKYLYIYIYTYV